MSGSYSVILGLFLVLSFDVEPLQRTPPMLLSLPPEIHLMIFSHLHLAFSTCLGLTYKKKLYAIHRDIHGTARCCQVIFGLDWGHFGAGYFWEYLKEWMESKWVWWSTQRKWTGDWGLENNRFIKSNDSKEVQDPSFTSFLNKRRISDLREPRDCIDSFSHRRGISTRN